MPLLINGQLHFAACEVLNLFAPVLGRISTKVIKLSVCIHVRSAELNIIND